MIPHSDPYHRSRKTQNSPPQIPPRLLRNAHLCPRLASERRSHSHPPLPSFAMQTTNAPRARWAIPARHRQGRTIPGVFREPGWKEGGRSATQRGCVWQSSFPTAAHPPGAARLLLWGRQQRLSLHLVNPLSLCFPSRPPGSPGNAVPSPAAPLSPALLHRRARRGGRKRGNVCFRN